MRLCPAPNVSLSSRRPADEEATSSRSHTLVNLVTLSDLPIVMPHVPELDYMSYISCVSPSLSLSRDAQP